MTRYIFITGGVTSSLGKGLTTATLGFLLQAQGFSVCLRKFDPYLNVDPGTMSPTQHGEVYVTQDGMETDLDLGHYERFTGVATSKNDSISAGKIYQKILEKERRGDYLGKTVQVVPHVTDIIKACILAPANINESPLTMGQFREVRVDLDNALGAPVDFMLCEIGGTVGDIESLPFLEAVRQLENELPRGHVCMIHVTLLPYIAASKELKTKPTQHSVRELRSIGINADILVCRTQHPLQQEQRRKISVFCSTREENVIEARDVSSVYDIPVAYHIAGLDKQVMAHFQLPMQTPNLRVWEEISQRIHQPKREVAIGIVYKYGNSADAYLSLQEAFVHAGIANYAKVELRWIDAKDIEHAAGDVDDDEEEDLDLQDLDSEAELRAVEEKTARLDAIFSGVDAILVPGGFGERGAFGKIEAIRYARENKIPFFGICLGMQMAVVEAVRNLLGLKDATSGEFDPQAEHMAIGLLTQWMDQSTLISRGQEEDLGGSMRLGSYESLTLPRTKMREIYQRESITERHRHRYEVNTNYKKALEQKGFMVSATSKDGLLVEAIEIPSHPWFIGVQYHPELVSKPFAPHPLFVSFVQAALERRLERENVSRRENTFSSAFAR